jgi:L-alanine-DL-glutamate epimerase-like enolase superfamily enzyme
MNNSIVDIRARLFKWVGEVLPAPSNFCTNASDLLPQTTGQDTMATYKFLGWLVVEVETDAGIVGIGNAALAPVPVKATIETYLKPLLIGESVLDYEYLWQKMYRQTLAFGRKGIGMTAISAVDIAVWDAIGKTLGQPVFRLLGGRTKNRIPVYASKLYSQPLESLREEAQRYVDEGYSALKLRFGWGPRDGAEGMRRNEALVRTVREVAGDDIDVMADAYMGWTFDYARRMLPRLEPYRLRWLEEPLSADDIDGYARLNAMNIMPISGGEHEFTLYGFRQLLEARAVDVVQFDVNRVGGISQAHRIAALADAFSVPVIPHAGQLHNYHIVMAHLNAPIAEYFPKHPVEIGNELFWYLFDGEPTASNGTIDLSDVRPGLGLSLTEEYRDQFEVID